MSEGQYETLDITIRLVRYSDGLIRVEQVEPAEEKLSEEIDDSSLSEEDLLIAINHLAIYQLHRTRAEDEPTPKRRGRPSKEDSEEKNEQYAHRSKIIATLPRQGGVYAIKCNRTERVYVGASKNIKLRAKQHLIEICSDNSNHPLADAFQQFGLESISIEVVELVEDCKELSCREKYWIKEFDSILNGYNHCEPSSHPTWT